MLFNSLEFLIFFPIVLLVYFTLPKKIKNFWLLIASYYFYMCWNVEYGFLILFLTVITYLFGLLLEKIKMSNKSEHKKIKLKKLIVSLCVIINILILVFFKYNNFLLDLLKNILSVVNIELKVPVFDILLPVGISFYTFQALGYIIDVYRDKIPATKNFFKYALFVSFFPQLVAGPIERSENLLTQLEQPKKFNPEFFKKGLLLMLWGFFLKIVLADRIAIFVNTIYGDYMKFGGWFLIIATLLFAFQTYGDFYGYSVIAKGAAKILGIELSENFNAPYFSTSIASFWNNWHISLTSWFKDYIYIPLGGSRKGKLRKYFNQMTVFLISGVWHGADITFVIWGILNGLYQVLSDLSKPFRDKVVAIFRLHRNTFGHKLLGMISTFLLIDFTLIFFRANNFKESLSIMKQIFTVKNPWILFDGSLYNCGLNSSNFILMLMCIVILLFADVCKYKKIVISDFINKQDYWFRWLVIILAVLTILTFGIWGSGYNESNFVYFQF